ncbi:shufflon system plasmid conjugative transfer pilus tip adhesin PilV [Salmonella enterica subsp. enterica serovar Virchow]|uniref:shufflon system plasmid conjugative transfer pilus tip adhesin PilV n=1 Tax=Escherichia coli TaxID=562 RepID=UPI0012CC8B2F|nr:shufflon system plasmid conjugative transfer pilus tip adhesin PilV [Escherichia coli]EBY2022354.1 shufflon system plasmid conjugative transfer pilus tip adhesin PilV [Salmonella enterica subsp. enterica serovar Virchow]EFZ4958289.1 shufflon system plasmid conjugative transfer pilus tip adhesin PilV [Shigella sonnei]EJK4637871.1 shufflon system plasmid conjugative transfer pilus tip adhesin PilV [Salmonella enterica]MCZ5103457.1 shufflon system plasmid conjugative transfer pilus tip adhesin 
MKKFRHDDDKGFILLEILAGLIVIGIATPMIYSEIEDWLNEQLYQSAALHADEYNNAIKNYVADKTSSLSSKTITVNELIQQGYLNNGFSRSPFGHSYITGIRKNNLSGRLEALTCTTGGQDIKEDGLRRIAGQINGLGGFMLQNNSVTGAFGGWTDLGSNYQITCNKGHIAMRMAGKDLEESDRLYRYSVQGRPDLNRMHTGIDMNNNSITNINEASGKNARFSGDVTSNRWLHPNGGGFTMTDSQWIRAVNNKGITTEGELKGGKVSGGTVRSEGRLSTGEYLQLDKTATAGTSCSPDGLVGRDSKGAILSCQSGVWRTIGAPDGSYSNLGSHRGTFNGRNNGRGTLFVYASGGNGAGGGDCANTSNLQGYVNGAFIGMNASNNPSYGKTAFISFAVPVGASYQIISRPTQNYACGNGVFSVYAYQM